MYLFAKALFIDNSLISENSLNEILDSFFIQKAVILLQVQGVFIDKISSFLEIVH